MKRKITSATIMPTQEGTRLAYSYSEIDDQGNITSRHNTGAYIIMDDVENAQANALMSAALEHLESTVS